MTTETMTTPHWYIYRQDATQYWDDPDLVARSGGTIYGMYLFDNNRHVHCCEITPSYEMEFLESVPKSRPEDECLADRLDMDVMEGDTDRGEVSYFHVHNIDLAKCIDAWAMTADEWQTLLDDADGDTEQAYEAALEAAREYVHTHGLY